MLRHLLVLTATLLLVACGSGESPAPPGDDGPTRAPIDPGALRLLEEGEALVSSDPAAAAEVLTRSLEAQKTARGHLARARAKLGTARMVMPGVIPPDVAADLDAALALDPGYTPALWFKAERLGIGRPDAQALLKRIVEIPVVEDDGLAWLARARAAAALDRKPDPSTIASTSRDFERASELRPGDAEVWLRWGIFCHRQAEDETEAAKHLRKCVALDPDGRAGRKAASLLDEM